MQENAQNGFDEGYCYGKLDAEDLLKVQQLEEQFGAKNSQKYILIAYQSKA